MNFLRYFNILFLIYSISIFAQTYSGPSTGTVASGIMVSTDDFTSIPEGNKLPGQYKVHKHMDYIPPEGADYTGGKLVFDNCTYVEDTNAKLKMGNGIGTNFVLHNFAANTMTNSIPPDPHTAVGPNHVISIVNGSFHIYDREGNLLKNISTDSWVHQATSDPLVSDPQVIYDHYANRWVMGWLTSNDATLQSTQTFCYSDDDNPVGTWYMYASNGSVNGTINSNAFGDYPQYGYDDIGIYISTREFTFTNQFVGAKIRILTKSELYAANGGPITFTDIWNIRLPNGQATDDLHPTISYDSGNNTAYFIIVPNQGSYYALYKITNPITSPVLTGSFLSVSTFGLAPDAQQLGGGQPLSAGAFGSGMRNAPIIRDGSLYAVHHIKNSQDFVSGSIKYFVIDLNSSTVTEQVEFGAEGFYYIYPAIAVDIDHNVAITYTRSGLTEYAGSYYTTRLASDPQGLFSESQVMTEGKGNYVVTFGGTDNRWGDYLDAALDPVNQYNIWLFSEYASAANQWGTWLTEIRMEPFTGIYPFTENTNLDFGDVEINTTGQVFSVWLSNYGTDDLIINSMPDSAGDFHRISSHNFPLTLSTYDSVKIDFTFNPTIVGSAQEDFLIPNNSSTFTGFTLEGFGYKILPAIGQQFYASSMQQNAGRLMLIDGLTGNGTNIGETSFLNITDIAIDPTNNHIWGLKPSDGVGTDILKINAVVGDGYIKYKTIIPGLVSMTFDTLGNCYGAASTGQIYSIDLTNGSTTLLTTSSLEIEAIAYNPVTDEMFASVSASSTEPDRLYKINLTTGDTTRVGKTGFNTATLSLAFTSSGDLFGLKGAGIFNTDFISINTATGEGTVIGSTGKKSVSGLGYSNTIITSVQEDEEIQIPKEFSLKQNYPNPFNPSTKIDFTLPIQSNVQLNIYDILGQKVKSLFEGELQAGNHNFTWNADDVNRKKLSSGIYFYELKAKGVNGLIFQNTKKMILLK